MCDLMSQQEKEKFGRNTSDDHQNQEMVVVRGQEGMNLVSLFPHFQHTEPGQS